MIQKDRLNFPSIARFLAKKISANHTNTAYITGSLDASPVQGTPDIAWHSLVFIADTRQIWTHGTLYDCGFSSGINAERQERILADTNLQAGINSLEARIPSIDTALDEESENPVQNRAVAEALNRLNPIQQTKTYTGVIGTANNNPGAVFYFMSVLPKDWNKPCIVKYRIRATMAGQAMGTAQSVMSIVFARNTVPSYDVWNYIGNTSYRPYYYHYRYLATETGFNSGYGHLMGIGLNSSYNPTNATYARTFIVEILEADNCTVTLFDSMTKYANVEGTGSTNYNGESTYDATTQGETHSGDRNNYDRLVYNGGVGPASANGVKQYSLIMQNGSGSWDSFTLTHGTAATKAKNPAGFRLDSQILYYGSSANIDANATNIGSLYASIPHDLRYSTNCGTTLTSHRFIYIVGSINPNDGLFYLDDTWWTQTLPSTEDGKLYILLGQAYSTYQEQLYPYHPIYYYKDGKIREYLVAQETDPVFSASAASGITSSDITNWNGKASQADVTTLQTQVSTYRGVTNAPDSLTAKSQQGVYYNIQYWKGLLAVVYDHTDLVSQIALCSSTPSYSGNTLVWTSGPCVMKRSYVNNSWTDWKIVDKHEFDSALSTTSENALQNKVIAGIVDNIQQQLADTVAQYYLRTILNNWQDYVDVTIDSDAWITITAKRNILWGESDAYGGGIGLPIGKNIANGSLLQFEGWVEQTEDFEGNYSFSGIEFAATYPYQSSVDSFYPMVGTNGTPVSTERLFFSDVNASYAVILWNEMYVGDKIHVRLRYTDASSIAARAFNSIQRYYLMSVAKADPNMTLTRNFVTHKLTFTFGQAGQTEPIAIWLGGVVPSYGMGSVRLRGWIRCTNISYDTGLYISDNPNTYSSQNSIGGTNATNRGELTEIDAEISATQSMYPDYVIIGYKTTAPVEVIESNSVFEMYLYIEGDILSPHLDAIYQKANVASSTAGKSAYQLAVDNGFVGTEAEWLASLKGAKGDTGSVVVSDGVAQITIVNDLTTGGTGNALSAEQGKLIGNDLNEIKECHVKTNEDGFFVTDGENNVGMKYTEDGLDAAKLSNHFKSLLPNSEVDTEELEETITEMVEDAIENAGISTQSGIVAQAKADDKIEMIKMYTNVTMGVVTDLHGAGVELANFVTFCTHYSLPYMLHAGDAVVEKYADGVAFWTGVSGSNKILNAIGNHDTKATGSNNYWQYVQTADAYNRYIKPFVDQNTAGLVQPSDVATTYKCYYYVDLYNGSTLTDFRLIVLDSMAWHYSNTSANIDSSEIARAQAQYDWLDSVLLDSRTNGKHVIICAHFPVNDIDAIDCPFNFPSSTLIGSNAIDLLETMFTPGRKTYMDNTTYGYAALSELVQTHIDASTNPLTFVGYICGHRHQDFIGHVKNKPKQFQMVLASSKDWTTVPAPWPDTSYNKNFFSVLGFSSSKKRIWLMRFGRTLNGWGQRREYFVYDYETHKMVEYSK